MIVKCSACGGSLSQGSSLSYDHKAKKNIAIPVAICVHCGLKYDRFSPEYYGVFADKFNSSETGLLNIGFKGTFQGKEYEIVGHIRYQNEEEYEVSTRDEWFAVSGDGGNLFFLEMGHRVFAHVEQNAETSLNLKKTPPAIEFDGEKINGQKTYYARVVSAQGELPYKPKIGERVLCINFKKNGNPYFLEKFEEKLSITGRQSITMKDMVDFFPENSENEKINKIKERLHKIKKIKKFNGVYKYAMLLCLLIFMYGFLQKNEILQGGLKNRVVLFKNSPEPRGKKVIYKSGVLQGPFEITRGDSIYGVKVGMDENVQPFKLQWQSVKFMLIEKERLHHRLGDKINDVKYLRSLFDQINSLPLPLESYAIKYFFEDVSKDKKNIPETTPPLDGKSREFVIDKPGRYYVYLELHGNKKRKIESVYFKLWRSPGSYYPYLMGSLLFFLIFSYYEMKIRALGQYFS